MRARQERIIRELLENDRPLSLKDLADKMDCSERTIRNDLKPIEKWFQVNSQSSVQLERQPGVGTYLKAEEKEREKLLQLIKEYQNNNQLEAEIRRDELLFHLLMSSESQSIDVLSEKFYESKEKIREDLESIKQSIQKDLLDLRIEPRLGTAIRGAERNKRNLLARLIKKGKNGQKKQTYLQEFFEKGVIEKVNKIVKNVDLKLFDHDEDYQISSITIHILFMIERIKNQSTLQLKKEEWALIDQSLAYEKSRFMAKQLSREFAFTFPEDEVGYLALHITSLQMDRKISHLDSKKRIENPVAEIIQLLVKNVSDIMEIDLSKDSILKRNLQSHLESAYLRVMSQFHISNPLLKEIKTTYTHLFLVIQMILEDYAEREDILFPEEEMAYLTVHFKAAFERVKEERNYRAIITCNHGIGVSSFLEAKIQHALPNINIVALLNDEELKDYQNNEDIDFVITTTERADISVPQIKVSPLMERKDMEKLKEFIKESQPKEKLVSFDFEEYTNSFLIQPQIDFKTKEACLSFMCEQMELKGYIGPHYKNSVFQREESSSTQIAPLVAIPHGNPKDVIKSGIFIATLKEAVDWGNGKVQLVLLLALHKEDLGLKETKNIFSSLYQLTANKKRLARLFDQKNQLGILKVLSENHSTDTII